MTLPNVDCPKLHYPNGGWPNIVCPNTGFAPNPLLELNAEAGSFSLVHVFAFLADEVLAAAPNGDDELRPTNAPKPPAGLFAFAATGANGEDVV